jgi:hypothetical protein
LLAVGYRLPDKHISMESWTEYFNQFAGNYPIVGDFNAHHTFGETKTHAVKKESCLMP